MTAIAGKGSPHWRGVAFDGERWQSVGPFHSQQEALNAVRVIAPKGGYGVYEVILEDEAERK
jgi:hypothetical protein